MALHRERRGSWLREPLVQFLLLGAGLFGLHHALDDSGMLARDTIVVDRGQVEHLAAGFARLHQRPPIASELQGLIDESIREEVFYREAMAQGLDRDDVIVRRRMMQKLEFLSEDLAPVPEPTDAQLQAHLDAHPRAYALAPRYTFEHVYLDPQKRGARLEADATALLATLRADHRIEAASLGDPFLLARRFDAAAGDDLRGQFGARFVDALDATPLDRWHGPIASGLGLHLVRIGQREAGAVPALADVRDAVRRDWMHERREAANATFYASLRKRYDIRVDRADPGADRAAVGDAAVAEARP